MLDPLESALDALMTRQRVLTHNVANIDTPGFTRRDVDFFDYMRQVFEGADVRPEPREDTQTAERLDGNNVTIERELFSLQQTELLYQATARFTTMDLEHLRYAIREGR